MKKLVLFCLSCVVAFAAPVTTGFHRVNQILARATGNVTAQVVPYANIYVTSTATGLAATIYSDPTLLAPITTSTVSSDANGNYSYYIPVNYCVTETVSSPNLGSVSTPNICGNTGTLTTPITIPNGGTGASTAAQALANLNGVSSVLTTPQTMAGELNSTLFATSLPGADPSGGTDNSSILNTALSPLLSSRLGSSDSLPLPPGTFYAPSISNVYGVPFTGYGSVLKSINQTTQNSLSQNVTATKAQLNSYAYAAPRLVFGQEYLSYINGLISTYQLTPSSIPVGGIKVTFSGDSTTAGTNANTGCGSSFGCTPDELFSDSALAKGIQAIATVNAGHSGADTADWLNTYLATDQATNPALYVIRWGINDPYFGITPAQTIANIRTGLSCIRNGCSGVTAKTVDQETVVLEMPSSTNDNPNGRAPAFYEQLRNGFAQAARDYQAVFIDLYGYMPDNDYAVQTCMMDLPYAGSGTPPVHIHPGGCKTPLYNDILVQTILTPMQPIASNNVVNVSGVTVIPAPSLLAPSYPYVFSSYRTDGSWPYNGQAVTFNNVDGVWNQLNFPFSSSVGGFALRNGTASAWSGWTYFDALGLNRNTLPASSFSTGIYCGLAGGTVPDCIWSSQSNGTNLKLSDINEDTNGIMHFRFCNDANSVCNDYETVTRSGGSPTGVAFGSGVSSLGFAGVGTAAFAAGAGAGTSPGALTCVTNHICDSVSGYIQLAAEGSTPPTTGAIVVVTLGATRTNYPNCNVQGWDTTANTPAVLGLPTFSATTLTVNLGGTAFTATHQYQFIYHCGGQ